MKMYRQNFFQRISQRSENNKKKSFRKYHEKFTFVTQIVRTQFMTWSQKWNRKKNKLRK